MSRRDFVSLTKNMLFERRNVVIYKYDCSVLVLLLFFMGSLQSFFLIRFGNTDGSQTWDTCSKTCFNPFQIMIYLKKVYRKRLSCTDLQHPFGFNLEVRQNSISIEMADVHQIGPTRLAYWTIQTNMHDTPPPTHPQPQPTHPPSLSTPSPSPTHFLPTLFFSVGSNTLSQSQGTASTSSPPSFKIPHTSLLPHFQLLTLNSVLWSSEADLPSFNQKPSRRRPKPWSFHLLLQLKTPAPPTYILNWLT